MKTLFATLLCLNLTACGTPLKALKGYKAAAEPDVKAAQDFGVEVWTEAACLFTIDAVTRHPQIIPALKALCKGLKESGLFEEKK